MYSKDGMSECGITAIGRGRLPAHAVGRIELIRLTDVVTGDAGKQDVPVDPSLRIGLFEFDADSLCIAEDTAQMIGLRAVMKDGSSRVSVRRELGVWL